jgi:hypothetical protein
MELRFRELSNEMALVGVKMPLLINVIVGSVSGCLFRNF